MDISTETFTVLDFETTGLSPQKGDKIIEIGVTKIERGVLSRPYSRFVHPKKEIPYNITQITGITNANVANAPVIEDILPKFRKYLSGSVLVAHNASFDMKFLNITLQANNMKPVSEYICTLNALRKLKRKGLYDASSCKLDVACDYFGIEQKSHHRAGDDAYVTAQLFLKIAELDISVLQVEEF